MLLSKFKWMFFLGIFIIIALIAIPINAKLYMWIDRNGNKHYSNDPPLNLNIKYREQNEIKSTAQKESAESEQSKTEPEPKQP